MLDEIEALSIAPAPPRIPTFTIEADVPKVVDVKIVPPPAPVVDLDRAMWAELEALEVQAESVSTEGSRSEVDVEETVSRV